MEESFFEEEEEGFFSRNKIVVIAVAISCLLFAGVFFMERSKTVTNIIPVLRGEVSLKNDFVITTIKNKYPIVIRKDDPYIGSQLRFSGNIKSLFSRAVDSLCKTKDIVVEIGSHFGYNVINIGNRLKNNGKYYAYEANYLIFSCLRKSIALNDLGNVVHPKNIAISDSSGTCQIEDCLSMTRQPNGEFTKPRLVNVNCSTLDKELVNETKFITMLLIDIPGLEFSIINGARKIIDNSPNIKLIVSIDSEESSKSFNVEDELQKFSDRGFKFYITETPSKYISMTIPQIIAKNKAVLIITKDEL